MSVLFYFPEGNQTNNINFNNNKPEDSKKNDNFSFLGSFFGSSFFGFNNCSIKNRKITPIESLFLNFCLDILLLQPQQINTNRSHTSNSRKTFHFNPRYTNSKTESNHEPEAESNHKPKAKSNHEPKAKSNHKPEAESNHKPEAESNHEPKAKSNHIHDITEATAAANTLGLTKSLKQLTLEDINTAYRKKALKYHPDKNKSPDAPEKFRKMTEARDVLLAYTKKN